jgi:hypothetical protein
MRDKCFYVRIDNKTLFHEYRVFRKAFQHLASQEGISKLCLCINWFYIGSREKFLSAFSVVTERLIEL